MSVTNPCSVFCCIENGNNAGGDVECAVGTTETMYYVHKDYLGSISAITDASGNLVESLSYDPCSVKLGFCEHSETKALVEPIPTEVQGREGRRRNPSDWSDYNVSSTLFDRGFTGHEHLPQFGLINMNGRVYDPFLARFLSPDPFVQAPSYSQNYNRYSYAWNNPLKYTDPSGYSVILDENTTNIPYIAGGSGFAGNWNNMTGGFGPGSGRHWSDQHRSEWGNFMLGSGRSFDRMYGQGASAYYIGYYSGENTRYVWNPVAGNEVYRESGKGYVNIYFSGDWVKASPFTGPTFGGSVPMYSNALTDGHGGAMYAEQTFSENGYQNSWTSAQGVGINGGFFYSLSGRVLKDKNEQWYVYASASAWAPAAESQALSINYYSTINVLEDGNSIFRGNLRVWEQNITRLGIKNYTFIGDGYMPLPKSGHNISVEISITYNIYQFWNGHAFPKSPYVYTIIF
jgi:RHS repeat-associated protein